MEQFLEEINPKWEELKLYQWTEYYFTILETKIFVLDLDEMSSQWTKWLGPLGRVEHSGI